MDKVKLGFIGTGGWLRHTCGISKKKIFEARLKGSGILLPACAIFPKAPSADMSGRPKKRNLWRLAWYSDYRLIYDKEDLDAVHICTPPFAHGEQERIAFEQGIAMLIEKPNHSELEPAIIIKNTLNKAA